EAKHRFGQFPMRRDQLLSQAEMVPKIGVDRRWQCEPARPACGQPWRRGKRAPFPENARGTIRRDEADHERRGEQTKSKEGENPTMAQEHHFSFTASPSLAPRNFRARTVIRLRRFCRRAECRFPRDFIVQRWLDLPTRPPGDRDPSALCLPRPPSSLGEIQWA